MGIALAAIPAMATLAGSALGMAGQQQANVANAHQAQINRDFQLYMSNTAWQRGVDDMKKAGLNPALAYQQGGATTAGGSTAHMENTKSPLQHAGANAVQAYQATQSAIAEREQTKAQTALTDAQTNQLKIESLARLQELQARAGLLGRQSLHQEFANQWWQSTLPGRTDMFRNDMRISNSNARQASADAKLSELLIPRAENDARAADTWFGRNISPYVNDAGSAVGIIRHLLPYSRRH